MGREGEREGEKHHCGVASRAPPTGDVACNPGMCPHWESNGQTVVHRPVLHPLSHTRQGQFKLFYHFDYHAGFLLFHWPCDQNISGCLMSSLFFFIVVQLQLSPFLPPPPVAVLFMILWFYPGTFLPSFLFINMEIFGICTYLFLPHFLCF